MNLTIPPETKVFRRVHDYGHKGNWHILDKISKNGFTQKSHPEYPDWWNSCTYIALCDHPEDDRESKYGFFFDGFLEFSTVGEIKKVCPSCWPFQKVENESINQTGN